LHDVPYSARIATCEFSGSTDMIRFLPVALVALIHSVLLSATAAAGEVSGFWVRASSNAPAGPPISSLSIRVEHGRYFVRTTTVCTGGPCTLPEMEANPVGIGAYRVNFPYSAPFDSFDIFYGSRTSGGVGVPCLALLHQDEGLLLKWTHANPWSCFGRVAFLKPKDLIKPPQIAPVPLPPSAIPHIH